MIRHLTYLDYSNTKPRTLAASSYVKKHDWSDSEDDMTQPDDNTSDDTPAKRRSLLLKLRLVLNKPHSYLVSLEIRCSKELCCSQSQTSRCYHLCTLSVIVSLP